jgi:SAM-dependent methyltransferase
MMHADFYDERYFEGGDKSNYGGYSEASSPFALHADTIERLLAHYSLHGPVLDVGCAKGYLVWELRRRGVDAWGVDWSEYAVARADDDVRPYLSHASATSLPYPDQHFAAVVSFDVLEHLDRPTAELALKECARVSERQLHQINTGRLEEWRFDGDASHCLKLPLDQWQGIARGLGLSGADICEPDRNLPYLATVPASPLDSHT